MGAGRPKSIDNTKVFDVARPGKSKPVSTSRPVIVNHSMAVKDPTVVTVSDDTPDKSPSPSASRKVISPISISVAGTDQKASKSSITILTEPKEPATAELLPSAPIKVTEAKFSEDTSSKTLEDETAVKEVDSLPDTSAVDWKTENDTVTQTAPIVEETTKEVEKSEETVTETEPTDLPVETAVEEPAIEQPEPTEPEEAAPEADNNQDEVETSDSASVDAVVGSADNPNATQKEESDKLLRDAELQKLIDSKKYVVPLAHDSTQTTSHMGAVIALLIIVLLLVGAYAAIDANLVNVDIDLPYNFINK